MTYRAWICETCRSPQKFRDNIWDCPCCGKEGCDSCFERYAHCKACAKGKTDEELRLAANEHGFDFEPDPPPGLLGDPESKE
jgi:hypothetical protein